MPIGILSDESFDSELNSIINGNDKPCARIDIIKKGRGNKSNTPSSLRKLIGEEGVKGSSNKELAELFNVSEQSVSAYKNGATSLATYNKPNEDLSSYVDQTREAISKSARANLINALSAITPDRINNAKLKDASQIAKDMSSIIKNIEPQKDSHSGPTVQFVMFAPNIKKEEDFDTKNIIDVG